MYTPMLRKLLAKSIFRVLQGALVIALPLLLSAQVTSGDAWPPRPATLPDISGLAWIDGDMFVGVHDAKHYPDEQDWPRISLVRLPDNGFEGIRWEPQYPSFPAGIASDLESISSIPGKKLFLLVESGQEGRGYRRIFLAEADSSGVRIKDHIDWPVKVKNVEATEVCLVAGKLVFFYAERAEGKPSTKIRWAELTLDPFILGEFNDIVYNSPEPGSSGSRPVVAMDIDSRGYMYVASAFDPNIDAGPFSSKVWKIGKVIADEQGRPHLMLDKPKNIAELDGLKVESLAIREEPGQAMEIYFGTDDENYGGIIRLLPSHR